MKKKEIVIVETLLYDDVCGIIESGRQKAYSAVNGAMMETYWSIGRRIVEEEQRGMERAAYGEHLIEKLSEQLALRYGNGFSSRYLRSFRKFYLIISDYQIWKSRFPNLTWTHIFKTLRVDDDTAARWYLETASQEMWSVRTLDRNISTQYYERHFVQPQLPVKEECPNKLELLKGVYVSDRCQKIEITGAPCRHADGSRADGTEAAQLPFPAMSFHVNPLAVNHLEVTSDKDGLKRLFLTDYSKALSNAIDSKDNNIHTELNLSRMRARSGLHSTASAISQKNRASIFFKHKYSVITHWELAFSTLLLLS